MAKNILKTRRKPKVVKAYRQSIPATRFIGIKYGDEDRVNGGFGAQWGQWHKNGWFELLEQACPPADFEDSGVYIGLMRWKGGKDGDEHKMSEPFQYWVGKFFAEGAQVPEGFDFVDFPASDLGVGWLYGRDSYIFAREGLAATSCEKQGMKIICGGDGAFWFFERYVCPRFTQPDKRGKKILDICHFVEKEAL